MDTSLANLLLTVGFVMLGSIVFHISTLISGYSIYREMQPVESAFLSTAAGIIIFLFSPIAFIVLISSEGYDILECILDYRIILSFLLCAIGLGMIFGNLKALDARVNLLTWIREITGVPFWISFYGVLWDDVLTTVKKEGEIYIEKDKNKSPFDSKGSPYRFISTSTFNEKREIFVEKIDSGDKYLIPLEEMGFIRIPAKSLRKHEEKINHIGQALCCLLISIGIFFLTFSAKETYYFIQNNCPDITTTLIFYWNLAILLIPFSIIILVISVWTAKKDFDNWLSYFEFCPDFGFLSIWLSCLFMYLIFQINYKTEELILIALFVLFLLISLWLIRSENYNRLYKSKYLYYRTDIPFYFFSLGTAFLYFAFNGGFWLIRWRDNQLNPNYGENIFIIFILAILLYTVLIRKHITNRVRKDLLNIINENNESDDDYGIMAEIVRKMYSEIYFDTLKKSNFSYLNECLVAYYSEDELKIAKPLTKALLGLERRDYLKHEAGTILFVLQRLIKEKRRKLKDEYRTQHGGRNN